MAEIVTKYKAEIDEYLAEVNKLIGVNQKKSAEEIAQNSKFQLQIRKNIESLKNLEKELKDLEKRQKLAASPEGQRIFGNEINKTKLRMQQLAAETQIVQSKLKGLSDAGTKSAKNLQSSFGGITSQLKSIALATGVAFGTHQLISYGKEAVNLAAKAEGVKRAFDNLNRPDLLDDLRKATKGTVNDIELMRAAVKAQNFKVPLERLAGFFEFARNRAADTGESVDYLVESIINGIGRKSSLVLDNLGISATELQAELKKTGDFGQAAANIIDRELAKTGDQAITTSEKIAQLNDNIKVSIGAALIEGFVPLEKSFTDISESATSIIDSFNKITGSTEEGAEKFNIFSFVLGNIIKGIDQVVWAVGQLVKGFDLFMQGLNFVKNVATGVINVFSSLGNAINNVIPIGTFFKNVFSEIAEIFKGVGFMVEKAIEPIVKFGQTIKKEVIGAFEAIINSPFVAPFIKIGEKVAGAFKKGFEDKAKTIKVELPKPKPVIVDVEAKVDTKSLRQLQEELQKLKDDLLDIPDTKSIEFRAKFKEVQEAEAALKKLTRELEKVDTEKPKTAMQRLNEEIARLKSLLEDQSLAGEISTATLNKYRDALNRATEAADRLKDAQKSLLDLANKESDALQNQIDQLSKAEKGETERLTKIAELREQAREDQVNRAREAVNKIVEIENRGLQRIIDNIKTSEKDRQTAIDQQIQNEINAIKKQIEIINRIEGEYGVITEQQASDRFDLEQDLTDKVAELDNKQARRRKLNLEEVVDFAQQAALAYQQAALAYIDLQRLMNDAEAERLSLSKQRLSEYYDGSSQALEDSLAKGLISETLANNKRISLEKGRAAAEAQIRKKENELKTKQAQQEKAATLIRMGINLAEAISKTVALLGLPGFVLSAIVSAFLGAQIAEVAATPVPQYASEGDPFVQQKGKRSRFAKGTDTVDYVLTKGEAVIPEKKNSEEPGLADAWINGYLKDFLNASYIAPALAKQKEKHEKHEKKMFAKSITTNITHPQKGVDKYEMRRLFQDEGVSLKKRDLDYIIKGLSKELFFKR